MQTQKAKCPTASFVAPCKPPHPHKEKTQKCPLFNSGNKFSVLKFLLAESASTSLQSLPQSEAKKLCFNWTLGSWWAGAAPPSSSNKKTENASVNFQ
jgi:hypothetical protein